MSIPQSPDQEVMNLDNAKRTSFDTKYHIVWDEQETIGDTSIILSAMWFPKECYGLIELATIVNGDWKRGELIPVTNYDYKATIRKAQEYWEEEIPKIRRAKKFMEEKGI